MIHTLKRAKFIQVVCAVCNHLVLLLPNVSTISSRYTSGVYQHRLVNGSVNFLWQSLGQLAIRWPYGSESELTAANAKHPCDH